MMIWRDDVYSYGLKCNWLLTLAYWHRLDKSADGLHMALYRSDRN